MSGNSAYTNYFKFHCERLPTFSKKVQSVTLPGLSVSRVDAQYSVGMVPLPSDKATYEPLVIDFIVDEKFQSWLEVYDWMTLLSSPTKVKDRNLLLEEITVIVLTPNQNPLKIYKYVNCFPSLLSPITLNQQSSEPVIGNVTFEYSYYEVESVA